VLGGVAVAASVLMAEGRFGLYDTILGICLLLVLHCAAGIHGRSPRLDLPFCAFAGVGWLLTLGILVDLSIILLAPCAGDEWPPSPWTALLNVRTIAGTVLWLVASSLELARARRLRCRKAG
jgi:hypothetical protein